MRDKNAPPESGKAQEKGVKSERLVTALRANLARRKAQKRLRARGARGNEAG